MTTLAGGIPDRVPVVPRAFLFSVESAGLKMSDVVRSPERMARALAECLERYSYDGCIIDFDDATLAEACGAKVIYHEAGKRESDGGCRQKLRGKHLLIRDGIEAGFHSLGVSLRVTGQPGWNAGP
jgi:hypothetical protein